MPKKATVKYRSLRSNLVHLPLSLYASLAQQQTRPQGVILHLKPLYSPPSSSSSRRPEEAYLGWSGLAAASSLVGGLAGLAGEGLETVEIDPEVAMGMGWGEGTVVEVSIIHNPTKARSVSVTPLTADDWEILEQHASFLENNLLGQLRAARAGQELDVWVMGRTKLRIKVDATDPKTDKGSAVLISPDTEIYVAPRKREAKDNTAVPLPKIVEPVNTRKTADKGKEKERGVTLRLVPARIATRWGRPEFQAKDLVGQEIGLCHPDTLDRVRKRLSIKNKDGYISFQVSLERPKVIVEDGDVGADTATEEGRNVKEIFLVAWDEMPEGHISLAGQSQHSWLEWTHVRITNPSSKKGRLKRANGHVPRLVEFPTPMIETHLAGVTSVINSATAYLARSLGSGRSRPLLITGSRGSGKTTLAKRIASRLETDRDVLVDVMYEDVARVDSEGRLGAIKEQITAWKEEATRRLPCLLILDGLELLLGPENELAGSSNPTLLAHHFVQTFSDLPDGLLVLATSTGSSNLHPILNSSHIFGEVVKIPALTKETRREVFQTLVNDQRSIPNETDGQSKVDFVTLASNTEGYSLADLNDLMSGAMQQAAIRCGRSGDETLSDFEEAQAAFTPMSLRGAALQKSDVKWSDIGGLHEPRRILRETLEWPTRYAQIFASCPLRLRSGLLLYGFPGCGKTLLASAVAKECGLNFMTVKGPEILNKYIGASEKAVRDLFERASAAKPCVLFFDEFDSIAPKRGHDSTGVTDRVVNQMLTEMDGAQGLEGVYVLAATSRPDLIDPALLRPGRLDKAVLCDMPGVKERLEILKAVSGKLNLASSCDLEEIAGDTEGYSGADLQAIMYNAHLEVVHASIAATQDEEEGGGEKGKGKGKGKGKEGSVRIVEQGRKWTQVAPVEEEKGSLADRNAFSARIDNIVDNSTGKSGDQGQTQKVTVKPMIEHQHLLRALATTRPSVSVADKAKLQRIYRSFLSEREGGLSNGDSGRDTGTRVSLM